MSDLNYIVTEVKSLTAEVGSFIRKEGDSFDLDNIEYKGFNDLVSYVDKEAEKKLVERLKGIFPDAGFITEEDTETVLAEEYNWIIDPLDGTTNFLHGLPVYAISIALQKNDSTVLGVVHELNRDECFSAIMGKQAECNDKAIQVSGIDQLSESLLATGFPYYDFERVDQYIELLKGLMKESQGLRRMGSAAVDLAYTACGRFEGFYEYNLNPWDVAAGAFIVKQAGGIVTDFKGKDNYTFGREIVAACSVHSQLLNKIQEFWA